MKENELSLVQWHNELKKTPNNYGAECTTVWLSEYVSVTL